MTEKEAINALRLEGGLEITGKLPRTIEFFKGLDAAIVALEEIQQYRAIGTVEECREAREKQKPKKVVAESSFFSGARDFEGKPVLLTSYTCPVCDCLVEYSHCINCGQALDWSK